MPAPHVVLLASSISLRPVFPYFLFSNSFPCHRSENSPVSLAIATLPKTAVSNPCVRHTSETPRGWLLSTFQPSTFDEERQSPDWQLPSPSGLSPFFSYSCALFCTQRKLNSFVFNRFRTLWQKQPGVGVPTPTKLSTGRPLPNGLFCPILGKRNSSLPSPQGFFNGLRNNCANAFAQRRHVFFGKSLGLDGVM